MPSKVFINVYDMTTHNRYTYPFGLGIFHSGVEVYGTEYSFGGHEHDYSGIFEVRPRIGPGNVCYRESIDVGETRLTREEVKVLIKQLSLEFTGRAYNMLRRNCNHFSSQLAKRLCNANFPGWINRLATVGAMFPCVVLPESELVPKPPTAASTGVVNQEMPPPTFSQNATLISRNVGN